MCNLNLSFKGRYWSRRSTNPIGSF